MNLRPQIEARADSGPPANTENEKAANFAAFLFAQTKQSFFVFEILFVLTEKDLVQFLMTLKRDARTLFLG